MTQFFTSMTGFPQAGLRQIDRDNTHSQRWRVGPEPEITLLRPHKWLTVAPVSARRLTLFLSPFFRQRDRGIVVGIRLHHLGADVVTPSV